MLGTVIGDMVGSVYEFKNHRSKLFEPLFHANARFTDDSVCTVAVADALVNGRHPQEALIDWCNRYAENGGWGKRFAEWFTADQPAPYGSYGNGAAMRISPVGLLAASLEEAFEMSDFVTNLTHNHPEAIASARAVVAAIHLARHGKSPREITPMLSISLAMTWHGHQTKFGQVTCAQSGRVTRFLKRSFAHCRLPGLKTRCALRFRLAETVTRLRRSQVESRRRFLDCQRTLHLRAGGGYQMNSNGCSKASMCINQVEHQPIAASPLGSKPAAERLSKALAHRFNEIILGSVSDL